MPYKTIGFDDAQPEKPSLFKLLTGAAIRGGSGVLASEGGAPGAVIAGGGEGLAELTEAPSDIPKAIAAIPDVVRNLVNPETRFDTLGGFFEGASTPMKRIGAEAALGSVPFSKVIPGGQVAKATLRSGAYSGVGEALREHARGQDLDPASIAKSTAFGALAGNLFSRLGAPKVETPPAGPSYEIETTAVPGGRVLDASGKKLEPVRSARVISGTPEPPAAPLSPRAAYWAKQGMNPPVAPGRLASPQFQLPFEDAAEEAVSGGKVPYMGSGAYPEGSAAKSAARAAKEAEKAQRAQDIQDRIDRAIEEGNLQPGKTAVSEGGSVETPEGRMSYRTSYRTPKKADEAGSRVIDETFEPLAEATPHIAEPEAPPVTPLEKLLTSATEEAPRAPKEPPARRVLTPNQEPAQRSYDDLLARIKAEGTNAPRTPSEPLPEYLLPYSSTFPAPAWGMSAEGVLRSEGVPQEAASNLERITSGFGEVPGGVQVEGALGAPTNLERLDPTFKGFPMEPVSGGAGAQVEDATHGLSPLAQLFKSRVDAAGQGYRDLKAALGAEPGLKQPTLTGLSPYQIAGKGLREEAQAAGLPAGGATAPSVEPPPSGIGPSQTAKAREAALAKRAAAKAEQQQWLPDYEKELAEAQRMKEAGATPEQIQQTLMERLKGESGAIDPAFAALLARVATGAGLGGLIGGSQGHPIAGMLVGGAMGGALSPNAVSAGLRQLGASPQLAAEAMESAQTPEGVKATAQKLYSSLPQYFRFNYLMDAWGLPANALVGPYGSAAMAGLEAHLAGDPRGMEVLKRLNPSDFVKRWAAAKEEAQKLIAEGEMGRAETKVMGTGAASKLFQWPGVQMTAGDVAARQILEEAGFTEEEARRITLTSEPETVAGRRVAEFSKGSPLLQVLQPFARTPANIGEQGAIRTPVLGSLVQILGRETPDPLKRQLIQQGLGLAAGGVGYAAGSTLDPETARVVRRYMSNFGGQYSLPTSLGFAMGEAHRAGKDRISPETAANLYNALPLPSTAPVASWVRSALTGAAPRGFLPPQLQNITSPTPAKNSPLVPSRLRTIGF